jgi:hypothetical protein
MQKQQAQQAEKGERQESSVSDSPTTTPDLLDHAERVALADIVILPLLSATIASPLQLPTLAGAAEGRSSGGNGYKDRARQSAQGAATFSLLLVPDTLLYPASGDENITVSRFIVCVTDSTSSERAFKVLTSLTLSWRALVSIHRLTVILSHPLRITYHSMLLRVYRWRVSLQNHVIVSTSSMFPILRFAK